LIAIPILKRHTSSSWVYYKGLVDIYENGLLHIYVRKKDFERMIQQAIIVAQDEQQIETIIAEGMGIIKEMKDFMAAHPSQKTAGEELLTLIEGCREILYRFSAYFDYTHYLGKTGVIFSEQLTLAMGRFHEERKKTFMAFFSYINSLAHHVGKKMSFGSCDLLTLDELFAAVLAKDLSPFDKAQHERKKRCMLCYSDAGVIITTDAHEIASFLSKWGHKGEMHIKGQGIGKGIIRGEVALITQATPLGKIPQGKIIVCHGTTPDMTPALKKALAVVTDEGGILSHAANFAREFGIPVVIGTRIATRELQEGDSVEVDIEQGIVRKVT